MAKINVTEHILKFRHFLLSSWNDLDLLMEDHDWHDDGDFTDDWLQVNWEFLVERQLLKGTGFLNTIGIYSEQPRITSPQAQCTHLILCTVKDGKELIDCFSGTKLPKESMLLFRCFYKNQGTNLGLYPPFDHVEVTSLFGKKERFCFKVNEVDFFLCPIEDIKPL